MELACRQGLIALGKADAVLGRAPSHWLLRSLYVEHGSVAERVTATFRPQPRVVRGRLQGAV
jgi:hypothetical protein